MQRLLLAATDTVYNSLYITILPMSIRNLLPVDFSLQIFYLELVIRFIECHILGTRYKENSAFPSSSLVQFSLTSTTFALESFRVVCML